MASLKEYRDERLRKLSELKSLGVDPYPSFSSAEIFDADTITCVAATNNFDKFKEKNFCIVGRILNIRKFGKIAFLVVKDSTGTLQLFLREPAMGKLSAKDNTLGLKELGLLDSGDFIKATGKLIKTQTDEISIEVERLQLLTKTLRPMPSYDGFTNKEERMRRRYIDTNINEDVYQRFIRRSEFWQATRDFLIKEGFVEINIPVLENTTGGADATPFVTNMDALDQDFYLRISHELPLKRLLAGGYTKVFDIGPRFRNENYSDEHLPEHVSMEWYAAYTNWQDGMKLTQSMIRNIADRTWGTRKFKLSNGQEIDLGKDGGDFERVSFVELMNKNYKLDVLSCSLEQAVEQLKKIGGEVEKIDNKSRVIDKLWKKLRVGISGPIFLVDIPTYLQPLAKVQKDNPQLSEQFNLIIGGTEVCKAYSELNDPVVQLDRFVEQQKMREAGDSEAMMLDIDFVEMLEYGMPPACGYGHSERLFWLLEGVTAREGVPFPQLRREVSEVTKKIYPYVKL